VKTPTRAFNTTFAEGPLLVKTPTKAIKKTEE